MAKKNDHYMYIKDAEVLYDSKGKKAKAAKEADDIIKTIKQSNQDIENNDACISDEKANTGENQTDWKSLIIKAFKDGPLKWKPSFDSKHESYCDQRFETNFSKKATESDANDVTNRKMCGNIDAKIEAKSGGHAHIAIGETKLAKADYEAQFKGKLKASFDGIKDESSTKAGFKRQVTVGSFKAEGEMEGKLKGSAELNILKYKRQMEADANFKVTGKASMLAGELCLEKNTEGIEGHVKVLHGKVEGKATFQAKASVGKHKAHLNVKAEGKAKFKALDGKLVLKAKKREDGSLYIPGVKATVGQAKAEGEAEFDVQTDILGKKYNKRGKVSGKARLCGAKFKALSVDCSDKKDYGNDYKVSVDVQGLKANVLNVEATKTKIGSKTSLSMEATGAELNVGTLSATGIDNREIKSVKTRAGFSFNAGNINATGLGHKGVKMEANAGSEVNMFNLSIGVSRDSEVSVRNGVSLFNINLKIGLPRFSAGSADCGFNIGIPFLSGGGDGGGGRCIARDIGSQSWGSHSDGEGCSSGISSETSGAGHGEASSDRQNTSDKEYVWNDVTDESDRHSRSGLGDKNSFDNPIDIEGDNNNMLGSNKSNHVIDRNKMTDFDCSESNINNTLEDIEKTFLQRQSGITSNDDVRVKNLDGHILEGYSFDNDGNIVYSERDDLLVVIDRADEDDMCSIVEAFDAEEVDPNQPFSKRMAGYGLMNKYGVRNGYSEEDYYYMQPYRSRRSNFRQTKTKSDKVCEKVEQFYKGKSDTTATGKHSQSVVDAAITDELENEEVYNKYLARLVGKGIKGDTQRKCSAKTLKCGQKIWHDKEMLHRALIQEYTRNSQFGGETSRKELKQNSKTHRDIMSDAENAKHDLGTNYKVAQPKKKAEPKKPFGANKNIHTIFTLEGTESRPIQYIKENVACFGDD